MYNQEEFIKKFDSYGISRDWYCFKNEISYKVCYDKDRVHWRGIWGYGSYYCPEPEKAYDLMLDKLLRYKDSYAYEQLEKDFCIGMIKVLNTEEGYFYVSKDNVVFNAITFAGKNDKSLINKGYSFYEYDQYQGYYIYQKKVDTSVFKQLSITSYLRITDNLIQKIQGDSGVYQVTLTYDIPTSLQEKIIKHISSNHGGEQSSIENFCLYKEIIDYFTEEQLIEDTKKAYRNTLDKISNYNNNANDNLKFSVNNIFTKETTNDLFKGKFGFCCCLKIEEPEELLLKEESLTVNIMYDAEAAIKDQLIEYFRLCQGEYTHRQYELFLEIIEYYSKDKLKDTIINRLQK